MVFVPKKKTEVINTEPEDKIILPTDYKGLLFFYLDAGTGILYSTYNHPYHIIRSFWREDTQYDYDNSSRDAVTWLYHQIDHNDSLPETNACLDQVLNDKASLDDLSLTYLAEMAKILPGTIVGYASDIEQLSSILGPVVDNSNNAFETIFRDSNAKDAITTIVHTTDFANGPA